MAHHHHGYGAAPAKSSSTQPFRDVDIGQVGTAGISSLAWSPPMGGAMLLAATFWDNTVKVWQVSSSGATPRSQLGGHTQAPMCSAFHSDVASPRLFTAGVDRQVVAHELATGKSAPVGAHAHGIRCMRWVPEVGLLATAGWDRQLMYWDLRQPQPALRVNLPERAYAMDCKMPMLCVALAGQKNPVVLTFDLNAPQTPRLQEASVLKNHVRTIAVFPDRKGYMISGVEGRVSVHSFGMHGQPDPATSYVFKAHRIDQTAYPVNVLTFHPAGPFASAGADGSYIFWDKNAKQKLYSIDPRETSISAAEFSPDGALYAYAVSYDWSRGPADPDVQKPPRIYFHAVAENELRK